MSNAFSVEWFFLSSLWLSLETGYAISKVYNCMQNPQVFPYVTNL